MNKRTASVLIVLALYAYNIYFDFSFTDKVAQPKIVNMHSEHIQNSTDALLLGGSNVIFGLSAKLMTEKLNLKFHNLALRNEGFNDNNYLGHVEKIAQKMDRKRVRLVIYSSSKYAQATNPFTRNLDKNLFGETTKLSLIPRTSLLENIPEMLSQKKKSTNYQVNEFGDFVFSNYRCTPDEVKMEKYQGLKPQLVLERMRRIEERMKQLFPNAKVVHIVPGAFSQYGALQLDHFEKIKTENMKYGLNILFQDPIEDRKQLCDTRFHVNEPVREKRTNDLIDRLQVARVVSVGKS